MDEHVNLEITCRFAGKLALFANVRLFTGVGSHVASKSASCCARVVALCTNKGLLSAVNSHVSFQAGGVIARIAALVALVIFLCISLNFVHFELACHFEIFLFWRVLYVTMLWDDWRRKSNFERIFCKK